MKHLYISDLDGTLLNRQAELSPRTKSLLNRLISGGLNFTVATARTAATTVALLSGLNIRLPVILMNGVCIYDLQRLAYLYVETIPQASCRFLIDIIHQEQLAGFVYTITDDQLNTYYERADTAAARQFMTERQIKFGKKFTRVASFDTCPLKQMIYYSISGPGSLLQPTYERLLSDPRLNVEFYQDIYVPEHWYLEVSSAGASKYSALKRLQSLYQVEQTIAFGDNLNDLPLFRASDTRLAVANAHDQVKKKADAVIGSNQEDGVAVWLAAFAQKSKTEQA